MKFQTFSWWVTFWMLMSSTWVDGLVAGIRKDCLGSSPAVSAPQTLGLSRWYDRMNSKNLSTRWNNLTVSAQILVSLKNSVLRKKKSKCKFFSQM